MIFEKGDKRKNCARLFKIFMYTFLIFEKWAVEIFGFCKYIFLIFQKGDGEKIVLGFLRLVNILF